MSYRITVVDTLRITVVHFLIGSENGMSPEPEGEMMDNRQAHPTKNGPGRKHGQGVSHGTQPKPAGGAFLGQHKNPKRAAMKAAGGKRAFRLHGARVQTAA